MTIMSKTKPWSKKKKILVIVFSIIAFLLVAIVVGGVTALNWYCDPGEYTIESAGDYTDTADLQLVAHRGFRGVAPENTAPAFIEAGKAGFQAAECDIYRTIDGVWVIQHDRLTYRMMDINKTVEKATFEELMNAKTDNGINIDQYPDLKICTLEEFMQICSDYGMDAVIEFKEENNQEYYGEVIELCKKYPSVKVTFISFKFSNLEALRKICDNDLMYLVQEIKDEDIELAKDLENCGIDFNGNKKKNLENDGEAIKKCIDAGLSVGAWTIDNVETMKALQSYGVNMITTNAIKY